MGVAEQQLPQVLARRALVDGDLAALVEAQRDGDVKVMMQEFIRDAPSIVSYVREDLFGYNSDLKNYHPNSMTPFDNMMNVDI